PRPPPLSTLFPYTTLFRSLPVNDLNPTLERLPFQPHAALVDDDVVFCKPAPRGADDVDVIFAGASGLAVSNINGRGHQHLHAQRDRKSTRLNSSHVKISYA